MSTNVPNEQNAVATEADEVEATLEPATSDTAQSQAQGDDTQSGQSAQSKDARPDAPPPDYREIRILTLERALQDRETTLHSYIRAHKKAEAEFEAYKQRLERDRERELVASKAKFVERLLDVDDNLERTISAAKQGTGGVAALVSGLDMVHRQFVERLGELGLERVDPIGKPFDPTSMEALGMVAVNDPAKNDTVVVTLRTGYRLGDREIRPALVQVGRFYS